MKVSVRPAICLYHVSAAPSLFILFRLLPRVLGWLVGAFMPAQICSKYLRERQSGIESVCRIHQQSAESQSVTDASTGDIGKQLHQAKLPPIQWLWPIHWMSHTPQVSQFIYQRAAPKAKYIPIGSFEIQKLSFRKPDFTGVGASG